MYTVDYNSQNPEANILVKQQDIFQNTLTIKSVHCYYETVEYIDSIRKYGSLCCSPHSAVPIDVIYKSTPQSEKIFITLWGNPSSSRLIFNIDGKSNIDLIRQRDFYEQFDNDEWSSNANDPKIGNKRCDKERQRFFQQNVYARIFFELTREQLKKMCSASTLSIQSSSDSHEIQFEGDASGFITILQAIYNEAIDNTMYTKAKDNALSRLEYTATNIQADNNVAISQFNDKVRSQWVVIIIVGILATILLISGIIRMIND